MNCGGCPARMHGIFIRGMTRADAQSLVWNHSSELLICAAYSWLCLHRDISVAHVLATNRQTEEHLP